MDPNKVLYEYCPELQLVDMLDWLQCATGFEASPIPPALDSSNEKIDEQFRQWGPTPEVFVLNIQLL